MEGALGGSLSPFVAYLAETTDVDDDVLEELRRLVRELDAQREEGKP